MKENNRKILKRVMAALLLVLCMSGLITGCGAAYVNYKLSKESRDLIFSGAEQSQTGTLAAVSEIDETGEYDQKDDVALYIDTYGKLPGNYITKKEAKKLGWQGGELEPYAPGKSIGGDRFGNYEEALPEKDGRIYTECDIDTRGKKRGAKRIVFSNDGLIYYTEDHYESFELLYGEE